MRKVHPTTGLPPTGTEPIRTSNRNPTIGQFGWTRSNGNQWHGGLDLLGAMGSPVFIAHDGTVIADGYERDRHAHENPHKGFGYRLWVLSDDKETKTAYTHLAAQHVKKGQRVIAGMMAGAMGRTGNAKGGPTHTHFEVRISTRRGWRAIDPEGWLAST